MIDQETMAYVGRMPCGCAPAVTVDDRESAQYVARDIAEWVRKGWTVERHKVSAIRAGGVISQCVHAAPKLAAPKQEAML